MVPDFPETAMAEQPFTVQDSEIVAETDELRVSRFALAPGEVIPWHYHSHVRDRYVGLEGEITVETRTPRGTHKLVPGGEHEVAPKVAHRVSNQGTSVARFLLVQGLGEYDFVPIGGGPAGS